MLLAPQPVIFRVEYALEQAGGREFGSVFLSERENVALALVAAGLAKVRPAGGQQSPFYEDLAKAAEDAEARGLGLWNKDHAKLQAAVRTSASSDGTCRESLALCAFLILCFGGWGVGKGRRGGRAGRHLPAAMYGACGATGDSWPTAEMQAQAPGCNQSGGRDVAAAAFQIFEYAHRALSSLQSLMRQGWWLAWARAARCRPSWRRP